MPKTDSTTERAPGGTSAADGSARKLGESLAAWIDRTQPMECCGKLAKDCTCWDLPGVNGVPFPDEPNAGGDEHGNR